MTREEQADLVRRHYALGAAGDHAAARELLTDDFVITIPDFMPFGGTYRGKDAFLELIPKVRAMAAVAAIKPIATSFGSDHAVEIVEFTLVGYDGPPPQVAELIRFRGDRICEIRPFYSDPHPFMSVTARRG
ncbi:nuclear transport factor 2 family protein [Sphingomonas sp.]|uniref:nuclear transport factor 2 family protein n=1 Tax=Sphingomonas sp. TaxID=28214 RepID=UPI0035BC3A18